MINLGRNSRDMKGQQRLQSVGITISHWRWAWNIIQFLKLLWGHKFHMPKYLLVKLDPVDNTAIYVCLRSVMRKVFFHAWWLHVLRRRLALREPWASLNNWIESHHGTSKIDLFWGSSIHVHQDESDSKNFSINCRSHTLSEGLFHQAPNLHFANWPLRNAILSHKGIEEGCASLCCIHFQCPFHVVNTAYKSSPILVWQFQNPENWAYRPKQWANDS